MMVIMSWGLTFDVDNEQNSDTMIVMMNQSKLVGLLDGSAQLFVLLICKQ